MESSENSDGPRIVPKTRAEVFVLCGIIYLFIVINCGLASAKGEKLIKTLLQIINAICFFFGARCDAPVLFVSMFTQDITLLIAVPNKWY